MLEELNAEVFVSLFNIKLHIEDFDGCLAIFFWSDESCALLGL